MEPKKEMLIQSAAQLYSIGIDLDEAKQQIKKLVATGARYDSPEMIQATQKYIELKERWDRLEQKHLKLKAEILSAQ